MNLSHTRIGLRNLAVSQALQGRQLSWRRSLRWIYVAVVAIALIAAVALQSFWAPQAKRWLLGGASGDPSREHADEHDHSGHDHGHAGHDESNSIELSEQGRRNIGLQIAKVQLSDFQKSVNIPGIVVEKPGQSVVQATAPLTGIVTRIHVAEGAAVVPGEPLFDIRLTHEELVQSQADVLKTVEELRVLDKEIQRLEAVTADGAVPRKSLLERQYEQQKLEANLKSQRQALRLHGLSDEQVRGIIDEGRLVSEMTVRAPQLSDGEEKAVYQVNDVLVSQGQNVEAGAPLALLANHAELLVEGNAFESDLPTVAKASRENWPITVRLRVDGENPQLVQNLSVLYIAGKVDPSSRTLHFYVSLPNELLRDVTTSDGRRFVTWRFRPGQRVEIQVPVETWKDRIVLPLAAVAQDGVENYVFIPNGDHFDRRPVHVEYRDTISVVVANDGSIFPGTPIAISGAQQLQMALKNKSGGAIDPHAGHNH